MLLHLKRPSNFSRSQCYGLMVKENQMKQSHRKKIVERFQFSVQLSLQLLLLTIQCFKCFFLWILIGIRHSLTNWSTCNTCLCTCRIAWSCACCSTYMDCNLFNNYNRWIKFILRPIPEQKGLFVLVHVSLQKIKMVALVSKAWTATNWSVMHQCAVVQEWLESSVVQEAAVEMTVGKTKEVHFQMNSLEGKDSGVASQSL